MIAIAGYFVELFGTWWRGERLSEVGFTDHGIKLLGLWPLMSHGISLFEATYRAGDMVLAL